MAVQHLKKSGLTTDGSDLLGCDVVPFGEWLPMFWMICCLRNHWGKKITWHNFSRDWHPHHYHCGSLRSFSGWQLWNAFVLLQLSQKQQDLGEKCAKCEVFMRSTSFCNNFHYAFLFQKYLVNYYQDMPSRILYALTWNVHCFCTGFLCFFVFVCKLVRKISKNEY